MRAGVLVAFALLLGGCNMIVTEQPMFAATDKGTPELREGLWVTPDPECDFDPATPATGWPECADWMVVEDDRMKFPGETGMTGLGNDELPLLITRGNPRIWQISIAEPKSGKTMTFYAGFEPLETGADGRIIRYQTWPALCGPPPPPKPDAKPEEMPDLVTKAPFKGLTLQRDGSCTPADVDVLWSAVAESRGLDKFQEGRWVRATYP